MPRRESGAARALAETEPESRKQAILFAAAEIFHRKGFHATSIQDIAEEVGMLKGSLYYYISSKDDLLFQIINDVHLDAFGYVTDIFEGTGPAAERLREFVRRHVAYCASHQTWMGVYLHEYKALPDDMRQKVTDMRDRYEHQVGDIVEQGKREGVFRKDIDTRTTVRGILGMCNWLYHWYSARGPLKPEQIGEDFADMVLHGIETK